MAMPARIYAAQKKYASNPQENSPIERSFAIVSASKKRLLRAVNQADAILQTQGVYDNATSKKCAPNMPIELPVFQAVQSSTALTGSARQQLVAQYRGSRPQTRRKRVSLQTQWLNEVGIGALLLMPYLLIANR